MLAPKRSLHPLQGFGIPCPHNPRALVVVFLLHVALRHSTTTRVSKERPHLPDMVINGVMALYGTATHTPKEKSGAPLSFNTGAFPRYRRSPAVQTEFFIATLFGLELKGNDSPFRNCDTSCFATVPAGEQSLCFMMDACTDIAG